MFAWFATSTRRPGVHHQVLTFFGDDLLQL